MIDNEINRLWLSWNVDITYKEPPYVSMVVMQNRRLPTEAHFYFTDIAIIVLAVSFMS